MTVASEIRDALIPQVEDLAKKFVERQMSEEVSPDAFWNDRLIEETRRKFLGVFPYIRRRPYDVELAGWKLPNLTGGVWVLENGAFLVHSQYLLVSRNGNQRGPFWKYKYQLVDDFPTSDLRVFKEAFELAHP